MENQASLSSKFGFSHNGPHAARTMMLEEVSVLLARLPEAASLSEYRAEIIEYNLLGKPTQKSRELSFRYLKELYGLDSGIPLFRVFSRLWAQDELARPVLALTLSLARDPLLRLSRAFILGKQLGEAVVRENTEAFLAQGNPDRFSPASLRSLAQNINGTWTLAGYLQGHVRKVRAIPRITPSNVSLALFLGYLERLSGQRLFSSEWMNLLCVSQDELEALAVAASNRGQIVFMNAGGVKEVRFPGFLTAEEEKWLHE